MAVPAYTTDLTDIYTDTDNFTAVGGGRVTAVETDDYIQGNNCWSHDPFSSGIEGGIYNSAQTISAGHAVLFWLKCDVVATLATKAAGGMQALIGDSATVYKGWYVRGSDDYAAGGWVNVAVDPTVTQSVLVGSPSTTTSWFGCRWNVPSTGASKGYPMKIDAMRQGRCEILINGGQSGSLANFAGMAAVNDTTANKWGLFEAKEGGAAGYSWKGLMSFGPTSLTEFTDSNINIFIENTEYVGASFNRIEFNNSSSIINWTNISFTAIGTIAKGEFEMIDNCTFNDTSGVFTDMSTFIYQSNATITDRIFRRCGLVTQGGATFTGCVFDAPSGTVGLSIDTLSLVTGNTFNSDGTGHAVDLGNITSTQTITWNNTLNSLTTEWDGTSGSTTGVSGTANDAILVNVSTSQTLTISVAEGASVPNVQNTGAGTVTITAGQKTFSFTVNPSITGYEWRIYSVTAVGSLSGSTELDGQETATLDNQSYTYSYSSDTPIAVQIIDDDYEESITYYTLVNGDQDVTINLSTEENI